MVEVVDGSTGEIREVDKVEEALDMIERPHSYWRRNAPAHMAVDEGEWGRKFDEAFLGVQSEAGPLIWAESKNDYNDSRYATLGALLAKVHPILIKHKLTYNQGVGKINFRNDIGGKAFLPIWTRVTHVPTGEWQRVWVEMPLIKFDAQGYGSTMTYGRRYALVAYFGLAATDDDGVWASAKPSLDTESQEMALLKDIAKCGTEAEVRAWYRNRAQELASLNEEAIVSLKSAWQARLNEVKSSEVKPTEKLKRGKSE